MNTCHTTLWDDFSMTENLCFFLVLWDVFSTYLIGFFVSRRLCHIRELGQTILFCTVSVSNVLFAGIGFFVSRRLCHIRELGQTILFCTVIFWNVLFAGFIIIITNVSWLSTLVFYAVSTICSNGCLFTSVRCGCSSACSQACLFIRTMYTTSQNCSSSTGHVFWFNRFCPIFSTTGHLFFVTFVFRRLGPVFRRTLPFSLFTGGGRVLPTMKHSCLLTRIGLIH